MFANFFISPLLTANSTEHELMAVDSENSKNLQNDMWRQDQVPAVPRAVRSPAKLVV
jgi:insulysin